MRDYQTYYTPFELDEMGLRSPPGRKHEPWPEGQDYFAMMEKHGRPNGPFDKERKLVYRGTS